MAISGPVTLPGTCGNIICQAYGNEGTRRPTIPAYVPTVDLLLRYIRAWYLPPRKQYQSLRYLCRPYYLRYPGPSTQAFFCGGRPTVADLWWLLPTTYGLWQYSTFLQFRTIDLRNRKAVPGIIGSAALPYGNFSTVNFGRQ